MGSQRLNAKHVRQLAVKTGEDVTRAWTSGHDVYVATRDHRHGVYYRCEGLVAWWSREPMHFDTCYAPDGSLLPVLEPWE